MSDRGEPDENLFVSYPPASARLGRLITGQRLETSHIFAMAESSLTEPTDPEWKKTTAEHVEGADAVLALVTRHSDGSEEQRFELQTAKTYDKPVLGVKVYPTTRFLPSWTVTR